jgi:hypothetical protein
LAGRIVALGHFDPLIELEININVFVKKSLPAKSFSVVQKYRVGRLVGCKSSDTAREETNILIASKYTLYQQFLQKKARNGEVFCFFSLCWN